MQTKNKFPEKIISLLKRVYEEIKYKEIITDNGKEFSNKVVKNWLAQNKINFLPVSCQDVFSLQRNFSGK